MCKDAAALSKALEQPGLYSVEDMERDTEFNGTFILNGPTNNSTQIIIYIFNSIECLKSLGLFTRTMAFRIKNDDRRRSSDALEGSS